MMEENLFAYVEWSTVKHTASRFSVKTKCHKKKRKKRKQRVTPVPKVPCITLWSLYMTL